MDKDFIQRGIDLGVLKEAGKDEPWRDITPRPVDDIEFLNEAFSVPVRLIFDPSQDTKKRDEG